MEESLDGSITQENKAIVDGLRSLYNNYNLDGKIRFIDYLSELAADYPEEQGILEIIRHYVKEADYKKLGFYPVFERIIERSSNCEGFMLSLIGEQRWKGITSKILGRGEDTYFKDFIFKEMTVNQIQI